MASLNITDETEFKKKNIEAKLWNDMNWKQKISKVVNGIKTTIKVLFLIYVFMCGVDLLTSAFKLIGGKNINGLTKAGTLGNPIVGLIVGVLVTIMVQSSSTATAIIVSLVSSGAISIQQAIPVILGSNIGTSVTNTFVSFTQVSDRDAFERAFAGATIHDIFNYLSVSSLLSLEVITRSIPGSRGLLEYTTELIVDSVYSNDHNASSSEPSGLKAIIDPLTSKIIKINKKILECWATNRSEGVTTVIERFCDSTALNSDICPVQDPNGTVPCCFVFANSNMSDKGIGIILLIGSLLTLIGCLVTLVKTLNAILKGSVQEVVKKYINSDISCAPYLTGYIALIIGALMTIIMQSSSIFTSLLNPLIGMGVVSIERCYPLTLGSNIGTTTTAMLAAFTENSRESIQIALVHLIFNLFGILLFYPVPFMRFPIPLSKALGKITAKYRWFAIVYIASVFFLIPALLLGISNAGVIAFWIFMGLVAAIGLFVIVINILQSKCSHVLPRILATWEFLPKPLRSLEPYDKVFSSVFSCCIKKDPNDSENALPQMVLTPCTRRYSGSQDSGIDNVQNSNVQNSNDMYY